MLKLNKISLDGYKSIKECCNLRLEKLNVLIGANGSGKSNFLSFFKLLNFEMTGALQEFIGRNGGRDSLLHFGAKLTPHVTADLEIATESGTNSYRMRLADAPPDTLIFTEESILYYPNGAVTTPKRSFLGSGHKESALLLPTLAENPTAKFFRNTLTRFRFYQFHDTSDQSHMRSRSDLRGPRYLYADGGNVAAHLHLLREEQPKCYQRVVETVRLVFPFFRDFVLEPDNGASNFVMLRWKAVGSAEYDFGPHQISDGTLRFIALATLLLQPPDWLPRLITIDEPELGLHPYAIKILGSLIEDAANFTQIIVATQSASFIDQMEPDDVIVADMVDGASQFERLDGEKLKEWLDEYTLSELWEKNVVGGRP
ncbi:MAG: AAA family ATPase [Verrucomicrobiota bacterium]|nr:AAA family ATPase [Verrucomicrobiota bacterium]